LAFDNQSNLLDDVDTVLSATEEKVTAINECMVMAIAILLMTQQQHMERN